MLFHRISIRTQSSIDIPTGPRFHGQAVYMIHIYIAHIDEPRVEHQDQYPDDIGVVSVRNCEQGPR